MKKLLSTALLALIAMVGQAQLPLNFSERLTILRHHQ